MPSPSFLRGDAIRIRRGILHSRTTACSTVHVSRLEHSECVCCNETRWSIRLDRLACSVGSGTGLLTTLRAVIKFMFRSCVSPQGLIDDLCSSFIHFYNQLSKQISYPKVQEFQFWLYVVRVDWKKLGTVVPERFEW